jgi:predicted nucleic acid-binding Zn ribbon protein
MAGDNRNIRYSNPHQYVKGGKGFVDVEAILTKALKKHGIDKEISRYKFILHWPEIVGPEIAKRTKPECIRRGVLVVKVCDSAWTQELTLRKEAILTRVQRFLGEEENVKDIQFMVGEIGG